MFDIHFVVCETCTLIAASCAVEMSAVSTLLKQIRVSKSGLPTMNFYKHEVLKLLAQDWLWHTSHCYWETFKYHMMLSKLPHHPFSDDAFV